MMLTHARTGEEICSNAKKAISFWDNFLGLLNPRNPRSMVFSTRFGIHTLFMSEPIDVLILDDEGLVVKQKVGMKPYSFFFYSPRFKTVVEMPSGHIEKFGVRQNDKILFSEKA